MERKNRKSGSTILHLTLTPVQLGIRRKSICTIIVPTLSTMRVFLLPFCSTSPFPSCFPSPYLLVLRLSCFPLAVPPEQLPKLSFHICNTLHPRLSQHPLLVRPSTSTIIVNRYRLPNSRWLYTSSDKHIVRRLLI